MARRRTIGNKRQEELTSSVEKTPTAAEPASPLVATETAPEGKTLAEAPSSGSIETTEAEEGRPDPTDASSSVAAGEMPRAAVPAQCLTFYLAGDEYAVGILQIREIVEYETPTKVPSTPPWIRGVMNLRGTVVPVVDLALKFGLAETEVTPRTCIVMVEADLDGEATLMGVMVDAVVRVLDLTPEVVDEPPTFGTRVRVDYLLGVGKVDDDLVLVLDVDRVLSLDELLAVASVPDAAASEPSLAGDPATAEAT